MRHILQPTTDKIRVQTDLEGPLADAVSKLARDASIPLAAALRLLALDGLRRRDELGA